MSPFTDPHNCALDSNGNLKDAQDILFFDSEGDENPIQKPPQKGRGKAKPKARSKVKSVCLIYLKNSANTTFLYSY